MNILKEVVLKNGQPLILRLPNPSDAEGIIKYLNIVGGETDNLLFGSGEFSITIEQEKTFIENINNDSNSFMIIGTINEVIVSVAQISSPYRKRISHNSEIAISVRKDYWNIGIGHAVINELINFAKEKGSIKNIALKVKANNENAIRLYKSVGFTEIGSHKNFFNINDIFYDAILMELYI